MKLRLCVVLALISVPAVAWAAPGDPLVGDPFLNAYNGWGDPNNGVNPNQSTVLAGATVAKANWGINLVTGALQENSDGWFGEGTTASGVTDGKYTPYLLVNDNYTTPSTYSYSATLTSYDNDGLGLVFGYQGTGDYFRVGLRNQASNKGFPQGVSVQKVSGGVITSLGSVATPKPAISVGLTNNTPMNVEVKVNGTSWAVHIDGNATPALSGTDSSLAAGKIGLQSWYQYYEGSTVARWGVEASQVKVSDTSGTLFQDTFGGNLPAKWRTVQMTNSAGAKLTGNYAMGNFRQNFRSGTITEDSNAFTYATATTPNTDFLGPAIVVNDTGSTSLTNYEMKVRLANIDNDGVGVLVRALDDNNFYRINFTAEPDATTGDLTLRSPTGMSIQKVRNGVWSQLYRDNPTSPDFWTYKDGVSGKPFDLIVRAVGDQLYVQVIDDPDGAHLIKTYPIITDMDNPILAGSVGLATWGSGGSTLTGNGGIFSRYGGLSGSPLLIEASVIPEPASCLLACGLLGLALLRRRP